MESPLACKSRRFPYPCTMLSLTCRMKFTTYEKGYGNHTYHCSSTYGRKCTRNLFQKCSMWKYPFFDHKIVPILPHIAPTQSHHKHKTIGVLCNTKGCTSHLCFFNHGLMSKCIMYGRTLYCPKHFEIELLVWSM